MDIVRFGNVIKEANLQQYKHVCSMFCHFFAASKGIHRFKRMPVGHIFGHAKFELMGWVVDHVYGGFVFGYLPF